jgi:hypothetical protein
LEKTIFTETGINIVETSLTRIYVALHYFL